MSFLDNVNALIEQAAEEAANATPEEADKIFASYEAQIEAAEKEAEATIDAEIEALDKQLAEEEKQIIAEFEKQEEDRLIEEKPIPEPRPEISIEKKLRLLTTEEVAKCTKVKELRDFAKTIDVDFKNLKEIELIEKLKKAMNISN